jgi:glycosyltransferase involved in cell wall biosynthesis
LNAVHQFLPTFAAGDAIGNHVLALRRILREAGYQSEIFADDVHPAVRGQARHYRQFQPSGPTWLLYHLSTGSPMAEFLAGRSEPLAVYYHNITPAEFFDRWEPGAAENVRRARSQLRRLASATRLAMANSAYSAAELATEGYPDPVAVPVLVDFSAYDAPPDTATLSRLRKAAEGGGAHWLFVGRLAPNKCQHGVIGAFAAYRELFDRRARLSLVGGATSPLYRRALEQLVVELGLGDCVELADVVGFGGLLAYYAAADVFVSLSQHEGFGVPLLEAMHFGVPVVALGSSAVPETVGAAGLLLEDGDPVLVACAVDRVLSDHDLRAELVAAGREQLEELSFERVAKRTLEVLAGGGGG